MMIKAPMSKGFPPKGKRPGLSHPRNPGNPTSKARRKWAPVGISIIAALVLAALGSSPAYADTKVVSWTNAVKNTDGTNIVASGAGSLSRTTVEYGTCNAGKTAMAAKVGEVFVAAPATTLQVAPVVVQEYCLDAWHSNTFATTFAPCVSGAVGSPTCPAGNSARSNVAITTVNPPTPLPPGAVVVGDLIAYQIIQSPNRVELLAFGHVQPGTMCDLSHTLDGMFLVPYDKVTLPGGKPNTDKKTVFAACG